MAITYRAVVGRELTNAEIDANFSGLANGSNWDQTVTAASTKLTLGAGDDVTAWGATTPQRLSIKKGTAASPDTVQNPLAKIVRTVQMSSTGIAPSDGADFAAGLLSVVSGTASNEVQTVGLMGFAKSASTSQVTTGADDACGVYGVGRITGSGTGVGIGAFFAGRRDTDTGLANGLEISCQNFTATAGSYNSAGFSNTTGAWCNAVGNSDCGVGLAFGNPFGRQFKVGIGFNAQVNGGFTGGISDSTIRDDCTSAVSLDIRGTHATAAIQIASGAGGVISAASTTSQSSIRLPHGVAPTSPVNGDMWTTTDGLYVRINDATVGPLS